MLLLQAADRWNSSRTVRPDGLRVKDNCPGRNARQESEEELSIMNRNANSQSNDKGNNLYVSRAGWYALSYPATWVIEESEDCATLLNPANGVGALQISAYETPSHQDCKEVLSEYLSDKGISFRERNASFENHPNRCIAKYEYEENRWFKCLWYISQDNRLLMITYNCKLEYRGREDREVEQIVSSVTVRSKSKVELESKGTKDQDD
jgi:hypothetical protein